jgi:hypothetical protein
MKKLNLTNAFFSKAQVNPQSVEMTKNDQEKKSFSKDRSVLPHQSIDYTKSSIESTKSFKLALVACYAFLISVFGGVVYVASLLDPKFPF